MSKPTPAHGSSLPSVGGAGEAAPSSTGGAQPSREVLKGTEKKKASALNAGRPKVYPTFARPKVNPALAPKAMRVHPRGFRVLSKSSPLERNMTTYFRLPPRAPQRIAEEQGGLEASVVTMIKKEKKSKKVLLNGFMLLDAAGVKQPSVAKECVINNSGIVGSVPTDLSFFTGLVFLDVGENNLQIPDLATLVSLEELHLHCNGISTIDLSNFAVAAAIERKREEKKQQQLDTSEEEQREEGGVDQSATHEDLDEVDMGGPLPLLPRLNTLNLAFNTVKPESILELTALVGLERLDLSCNNLRTLPQAMHQLSGIRQLSLENNRYSDPNIFLALATMPNLVELNFNHNKLPCVPRIPENGFLVLETLGMAGNKVEYFEDLYPLTQIPALKCVVLYDNPIERRKKDKEILFYEFGNLQIQLVMTPPVPEKRKVGAFYAANCASFVKVKDFKKVVTAKKGKGVHQDYYSSPQPEPVVGDDSTTFFMTAANGEKQQPHATGGGFSGDGVGDQDGISDGDSHHHEVPPAVTSHWLGDWSEVADGDITGVSNAAGGTSTNQPRFGSRGHSADHHQYQQQQQHGGGYPLRASSSPLDPPARATYHSADGGGGGYGDEEEGGYHHSNDYGPSGSSGGNNHGDSFLPNISEPRGNLRSTMTELKRMLRQPLPPLSQSTLTSKIGNQRKR